MTFAALAFYSWYRAHRRHIKDIVDSNDFATAIIQLENLIAEHESNFPNDHGIMNSELIHMKHALTHLSRLDENSTADARFRCTRIFTHDPNQITE